MISLAVVAQLVLFQAAPTPTFTVAGTLVDAVSASPIGKGSVYLSGVAAPFVTGPDGKFRFDGVKAGKHQLRADRLGYVSQSFGQHALFTNVFTGVVAGGSQQTDNLVFRLIRSAVIAGYVKGMNGEPVVGMTVYAERIFGSGKTRYLGHGSNALTDDRGYYRIHSLAAGSYAVVVSGHPLRGIDSVQPMAYPVTFYPGTTDPSAAGFISVKPGGEASVDVTLQATPVVSIDGQVLSPSGATPSNLSVTIGVPSLFGTNIMAGESAKVTGGRFAFPSLAAGRYHFQLFKAAGGGQIVGVADVDANVNPTPVSMAEQMPLRMFLHLTLSGSQRFPNSPLTAAIQSFPLPLSFAMNTTRIGPDGFGLFSGLSLSRLSTLVVTQGRPLAVTSVKVNGAQESRLVFDVPDIGVVGIEATANASTVDVAGRVVRGNTPQSGIVVMVVQRDTWEEIGVYRSDQSDSDGMFDWQDLPPGEYLAFALEQGLPEDYGDVDSLRALMPIAQPLTLTEAPSQKVELKLLPLPSAR